MKVLYSLYQQTHDFLPECMQNPCVFINYHHHYYFIWKNYDKGGACARNFLDTRELRSQSNGTHIPEKEKMQCGNKQAYECIYISTGILKKATIRRLVLFGVGSFPWNGQRSLFLEKGKQNLQENEASSPAILKENTPGTENSECKGSETEANMVHAGYERETSGKCWTETRDDLSQFGQADKPQAYAQDLDLILCVGLLWGGTLNDEVHIL